MRVTTLAIGREELVIGNIRVRPLLHRGKLRLAIHAPDSVSIVRGELVHGGQAGTTQAGDGNGPGMGGP